MKIIIVGGGRMVYFLSRGFLSKGYHVCIVNHDAAECRWLARRVKAAVIHGDGSLPRVLEEAGADDADALLAVTPRDEDNLVICQIADKKFRVPNTLAVVSDPDNERVFQQLGVTNVVSMTRIVAALIEERTGVEEIVNLISLGEGLVNVTELSLDEACPVLGQPLVDVPLPRDALIGCILRGGGVIVPHGNTSLAAGDRVVLISVPQSHGAAVKTLTGEP